MHNTFGKRIVSFCLSVLVLLATVPFTVAAETGYPNEGEIVQFGSWPQSQVTDPETIALLDGMEKVYATEQKVSYAELVIGEDRYRAVTFNDVRNDETEKIYPAGGVYYFRYEPLEWVVVDAENNELQTLKVIDAELYGWYDTNPTVDHYKAWNYSKSNIRDYLNEQFYPSAFTAEEQKHFVQMRLPDTNFGNLSVPTITDTFSNNYVYLQSHYDTKNVSPQYTDDTDYAVCKGANGVLWTRTTYLVSTTFHGALPLEYKEGATLGSGLTGYRIETIHGVRPRITLDSLEDTFHKTHTYRQEDYQDSTCTEEGSLTLVCTYCGHVQTQTVPKKSHTIEHKSDLPTCTENGVEYDYCTVCKGEFNRNTLTATGHSYQTNAEKDSTCTEAGERTLVCSACGDTTRETIDIKPHNLQHKVEPATCTQDGTEYDYCTQCNEHFDEQVLTATGHRFAMSVAEEPTCTKKGVRLFLCDCGESYTVPIDETSHNLTHKTDLPTCTEEGLEYDLCTTCNGKFSEKVLPAAGHKYDSVITRDATCTMPGELTYTCRACAKSYTESISIIPHNIIHKTDRATCTKNGADYDYCTVCRAHFAETVLPATGHSFEDGWCVVCDAPEFWEYEITNDTVTITGYLGTDYAPEIPQYIEKLPVTAIGEAAFSENSTMGILRIPDTIRLIEANAFRRCFALTEVIVGSGVQVIRSGAFSDCPKLSLVCVLAPECTITKDAFSYCGERLSFVVPEKSNIEAYMKSHNFRTGSYSLRERNGKPVIAFSGSVIMYEDLDYYYWVALAEKYPGTTYLYFDRITFEGMTRDMVSGFSAEHMDLSERDLTFLKVYISIEIDDELMTFDRLVDILRTDIAQLALTFDTDSGERLTLFQRFQAVMAQVFNALTKLVNAVVRIFKPKK